LVPAVESGGISRRRPPRSAGEPDLVAAVGEIYLELTVVDLENDEEIIDFASRFGPLGVRPADVRHFASYYELEDILRRLTTEPRVGRPQRGESLDAFRIGEQLIAILVDSWARLTGVSETVRPRTGPDAMAWAIDGHTFGPANPAIALSRLVTPALESLHPRILIPESRQDPPTLSASLYSICCLELYNHIVEEATYHQCAFERCSRLFVRQKGGAREGQYRGKGVVYCSTYCARAEAQQRYRSKKKATVGSP
jgi:hypothetical protein